MRNDATSRRTFLHASAVGLAARAAGPLLGANAPGANEKIVVGFMGCGGRGTQIATDIAGRPDVEVAWLTDADSARAASAANAVEKKQGKRPQVAQDFRRILDDKGVHALFNTTPDHWHALPSVLACQAGKDVYVEKPASHNVWEGRQMVKAARKYGRVVQVGLQNRSAPYVRAAVDFLRAGKLGKVHFVRVLNMKTRGALPKRPDTEAPKTIDYDLWLGPAPKRPFNPSRCHGGWYWLWDYSGGDIICDGVHQMDIARWLIGRTLPRYTVATGGRYFFDDEADTPDTQCVLYDYGDLTMQFDLTLWTPYLKKIPQSIRMSDTEFPDWMFCATRIEVYGSNGLMMMGRHGGGWQVFNTDGKLAEKNKGKFPGELHYQNFFDSVRSRKAPSADIEDGHLSTVLCHLGNISLRVGGRRLEFDPVKELCVGDDEANKLVKRPGRDPWRIPDEV
ncbi:MAG: Gfo/Idh/MocA family oxidoreductase [Planctomycetes bacterium]|nr:Gfo/Idh/MocA family oxidoreductase [Planctomycetota bacterium]